MRWSSFLCGLYRHPSPPADLRSQQLPPYCALTVSRSKSMSRDPIKPALAGTYGDVLRNHTLQMAAALSYYFVLSLCPSLVVLSAIVAYFPIPNLFDQAMSMMASQC
jgi:uncharacterized BrkB/YihY/UPF0761 family membrane protein